LISQHGPSIFPAPGRRSNNIKLWFFNVEELLEDRLEVIPGGRTESTGHIFPASKSGSNSITCPSSFSISISHLPDYSYLLHEQTGSFSRQACSCAGHTQILARAAAADNVHGRELCAVQLFDIPNVKHVGEVSLGDLDWKGFNLTGP
jgi:hypothetical protein